MDFDLDPLDGNSAAEPVKNVRKFIPKRSKPAVKKQPAATLVSTPQAAKTIDSPRSELSELVETAKPSENLVSGSDVPNDLIVPTIDGRDQMHDGELVREEIDVVNHNLDDGSIPTFQEDIDLYLSSPEFTQTIATSECPSNEEPNLSSLDFTHTVATSECPSNEEPNLSSMDFTHTVATPECPSNEEPMNLMEEGVHEIPAKLASRRSKTGTSNTETASDPSPEQQKMGRSLRPRTNKSGFFELVDEDVEVSEEYVLEEENIDDNEESQVGSEPPKKNSKRKSKISNGDKEKPTRKRKKATKASDKEVCVAKPKKFSHSTRRRRVDKAFLMIPDDEFNPKTVPLRDLIARADYIEKQEKKDKAAKAVQAKTQSTGNSSSAPFNEEETFVSRAGGGFNDDEEEGDPVAEEDTSQHINNHTFMDKATYTRWSKQDTELFYEAMSQFGSDLSMIQLRFPDRERSQLKRKYKKEEREHPMRVRDALTNRTKDLSYLQEIVKQIKQQEAEERAEQQEAGNEDPMDLGETEETLNADDEEASGEQVQVQEEENNPGEQVQEEENNPGADDAEEEEENEDDDDFFDWSQYKSDA